MRMIILFFMLFSFILESEAGFFAPTCSASTCGTLQGFKKCLADPTSPYRYFIYHPNTIGNPRAFERLRKFTDVHPNCYTQFCNRVCSTVPEQFQGSEMVRGEKNNWLSRQTDRLRQNERWRSRELEKRGKVQNQIARLCKRKDLIGKEIKLLCSECDAYLKKDRELIPACRKDVSYNPSQIQVHKRETDGFGREGENEDWGMYAIQEGRRRSSLRLSRDQDPSPLSERRYRRSRQETEERDDMSDVSSQRSGRSDQSRRSVSSRSSQRSQGSDSSRASQSSTRSQLTTENLAQLPRGKRQSTEEWVEDVSDISSESGRSEDAFSDDSSEDGSEEGDDDSETSSVMSDDD